MIDVIEAHRDQLNAYCEEAHARRLHVFGSAARGDFEPATSDLDFLVEFEELEPAAFAEAYFALKANLERLFGRPVDLLTERNLDNPFLRRRVLAERQTLYAR